MNKPTTAVVLPKAVTSPATLLTGALASTRGRVAAVALGSLFVALCAQIAVPLPWTPVPMTMQPFAVLLVGLLLGPGLGAAAMAAYLLEGAAGLPVFVPGFGGLLPLGPSAGYLLSYPLVAGLVGMLWQSSSQLSSSQRGSRHWRTFARALAAAALGNALILLCGACWLAIVTRGSFTAVLHLAVLPFIAGDAIKAALAAGIATGFVRARRFHPVDTGMGV